MGLLAKLERLEWLPRECSPWDWGACASMLESSQRSQVTVRLADALRGIATQGAPTKRFNTPVLRHQTECISVWAKYDRLTLLLIASTYFSIECRVAFYFHSDCSCTVLFKRARSPCARLYFLVQSLDMFRRPFINP